ncbi:protein involved in sex pheromone biosynthesis [Bacillus oleivorans]|uniref:Protein involved in sex pheromone biosynthesis n=1 Tax=Bacillus oleivorans TaxID=1448271 RepID=A0A285CTU7_9BACI|nr:CamS family sex pheromone protein [Bacillus oleivorans]SNX70952.1 protein involved in sex pheromone biosynthesis [Bacillus oleivorans]
MKKLVTIFCTSILLLTGCIPSLEKEGEVVQEDAVDEENKTTGIIPSFSISDEYYKTILPFEASPARGMVVSNLNTRVDMDEFETGLMRIAQTKFSTDDYLFRGGQYISRELVSSWLKRKLTDAQAQEAGVDPEENIGLNPALVVSGDNVREANEDSPIYLAHIMEQNYLKRIDEETVELGGVVIGLALNSVHYFQTEQYGTVYQTEIPHEKVVEEGKKIAAEVLTRLRGMEELTEVPITIALFKQEKRNSVVPGNFIAYTHVNQGESSIKEWTSINEDYVLFPSNEATELYREDATTFLNFQTDVESYFPDFNGIVGKAFYVNEELNSINIDINIQFNGEAEVIGFTQYVAGLVMKYFGEELKVEVNVLSVNGPEALIVKDRKADEPYVYVY